MKNFEMKSNVEGMQLVISVKVSWRVAIQYILVATLIFIGMISQTKTCLANGTGYAISLTPAIDPVTGNSKVSIDGYRGLNAHVVSLPNHTPVSGVTVYFYTTLGTLSTPSGTTNSNGDIGTTLSGGWVPGSATVRAKVTKGDTDYSDIAIIPVVAPNGETTRISGRLGPRTSFSQNLTPGDVDFSGLSVTESDSGGHDGCYFDGSIDKKPGFVHVTGGTWPVYENNSWGDDSLSWGGFVGYYRRVGRAPCGTVIHQRMNVVRTGYSGGNLFYTQNSSPLTLSIDEPKPAHVQNTRDSVTDTIPY